MGLLKTVKDIISDNIFEDASNSYNIVKKVFQDDTDKLFDYLKTKGQLSGFLESVDFDDDDEAKLYAMIISGMINTSSWDELVKETSQYFSDILIEGTDVYLVLSEKKDLAKFFESNRNTSKETIEVILGEDYVDWFNYYDPDFQEFESIIDDLNDQNISILQKHMLECEGQEIDEYEAERVGDEFSEIIRVDENKLTKDGFDYILQGNNEMSKALWELEIFNHIKDEIVRDYNSAMEVAYNDECYETVMNGVEDLFDDRGQYYDTGRKRKVRHRDGEVKEYPLELYKIKATNLYVDVLTAWSDDYGNTLDYFGDFENLLEEYLGVSPVNEINVYLPEYSDHIKTIEYLNSYFLENL